MKSKRITNQADQSSKMAQTGGPNLTQLYTDLNKFGQSQDFERALKVANKSNVYMRTDKNSRLFVSVYTN